MNKSDKDAEIKALKAALEKEQKKSARLKEQHNSDKATIKNLKRRKDPKPKSKKKEPETVTITAKQKQLLSSAFPDIDILSLLLD